LEILEGFGVMAQRRASLEGAATVHTQQVLVVDLSHCLGLRMVARQGWMLVLVPAGGQDGVGTGAQVPVVVGS